MNPVDDRHYAGSGLPRSSGGDAEILIRLRAGSNKSEQKAAFAPRLAGAVSRADFGPATSRTPGSTSTTMSRDRGEDQPPHW